MADPFSFQLPVAVRFGSGTATELAATLQCLGVTHALVVSEQPVLAIAAVEAALAGCRAAGVRVSCHAKPPGEPTLEHAEGAAEALRSSGADGVVGIGGGASIDMARAARAIVEHATSCRQLAAGGVTFTQPTRPLVAVPTTSGTGAEVTGAFVVSDGGRKLGIAHPTMRAQAAIVDPLLTIGLPPAATAACGIDALAQCIGGATASNAHPMSLAVGCEGVRHIAVGLERAVAEGSDVAAREAMAIASLFGGLAINLADCTADHALGHAIGGRYHLPHGVAVGVVLAESLEVNRPACMPALERLADAMGVADDGSRDGTRAIREVRRLLAAVGIPTARTAGVREQDLDVLVPAALADYCLTVNPHPWDERDVRATFDAALAIEAR